MQKRTDYKDEDLAIQDTLSMTVPERLQLIASLIVDKIAEHQKFGDLPQKVIPSDE